MTIDEELDAADAAQWDADPLRGEMSICNGCPGESCHWEYGCPYERAAIDGAGMARWLFRQYKTPSTARAVLRHVRRTHGLSALPPGAALIWNERRA